MASLSHRMGRGSKAMSETKEKRPFQGTREEWLVKREKKKKVAILWTRKKCKIKKKFPSVKSHCK
jgi:hypothetical protein